MAKQTHHKPNNNPPEVQTGISGSGGGSNNVGVGVEESNDERIAAAAAAATNVCVETGITLDSNSKEDDRKNFWEDDDDNNNNNKKDEHNNKPLSSSSSSPPPRSQAVVAAANNTGTTATTTTAAAASRPGAFAVLPFDTVNADDENDNDDANCAGQQPSPSPTPTPPPSSDLVLFNEQHRIIQNQMEIIQQQQLRMQQLEQQWQQQQQQTEELSTPPPVVVQATRVATLENVLAVVDSTSPPPPPPPPILVEAELVEDSNRPKCGDFCCEWCNGSLSQQKRRRMIVIIGGLLMVLSLIAIVGVVASVVTGGGSNDGGAKHNDSNNATTTSTADPSLTPTSAPSSSSTMVPDEVDAPVVDQPTSSPVDVTTTQQEPTMFPTNSPTAIPTSFPSAIPTKPPTMSPTLLPPSMSPTLVASSVSPTVPPSMSPTMAPLNVTWTPLGQPLQGENADDRFGVALAITADGKRVAVGAYTSDGPNDSLFNAGHVRVYDYNDRNETWNPVGKALYGVNATNQFGRSVALSADGSILAAGGSGNDGNGTDSGAVRIYTIERDDWVQIGQDIYGLAAGDWLGRSVALSENGTIVAAGADGGMMNGDRSGYVRALQFNGSAWNMMGQTLTGQAVNDSFGESVALSVDGQIMAVGAIRADDTVRNIKNVGQVSIFQFNKTSLQWEGLGQPLFGTAKGDKFGYAIDLSTDGNTLAVGGYEHDAANTGADAGCATVFQYNGTMWNPIGSTIIGAVAGGWFGVSVALSATKDGTIIAVGSSRGGDSGSGSMDLFVYNEAFRDWIPVNPSLQGDALGDRFGYSVAYSRNGGVLATGAYQHSSNAGQVQIFAPAVLFSSEG